MNQNTEITLQSLAQQEEVNIGYIDNEIVVVDSIQKFAQVNEARVAMNVIMICTSGRIDARMNDIHMQLTKNQVAIVPQNIVVTDIMISPDFDLKAIFLTNSALQSMLREKMSIWNHVMYVHHLHILTLNNDNLAFYSRFYDLLSIVVELGKDNPFRTQVVQSLFRAAMLGMCGEIMLKFPLDAAVDKTQISNGHFQRFLLLLHDSDVKYRSVESYASELCISPKYLTSICKNYSGKTASDWIREQVLEDIRYYLKKTDLSIKQVSARVGFSNASFFGKYVKEHLGMTPNEFRKS